jgi:hypothetical protein
MKRGIAILVLGCAVVFFGCSNSNPQTCAGQAQCGGGYACVQGGQCETACAADGGASQCPSGQTCQQTSAYCQGTACTAVMVWVCR